LLRSSTQEIRPFCAPFFESRSRRSRLCDYLGEIFGTHPENSRAQPQNGAPPSSGKNSYPSRRFYLLSTNMPILSLRVMVQELGRCELWELGGARADWSPASLGPRPPPTLQHDPPSASILVTDPHFVKRVLVTQPKSRNSLFRLLLQRETEVYCTNYSMTALENENDSRSTQALITLTARHAGLKLRHAADLLLLAPRSFNVPAFYLFQNPLYILYA